MRPRKVIYPDKEGVIRYRKKPKVDGREVGGYSVTPERLIVISSTATEITQGEYLLHELLHQSLDPLAERDSDEDLEETIVRSMANTLVQVWKANPAVFSWLHHVLTAEEEK
jgi:hypothetical protein